MNRRHRLTWIGIAIVMLYAAIIGCSSKTPFEKALSSLLNAQSRGQALGMQSDLIREMGHTATDEREFLLTVHYASDIDFLSDFRDSLVATLCTTTSFPVSRLIFRNLTGSTTKADTALTALVYDRFRECAMTASDWYIIWKDAPGTEAQHEADRAMIRRCASDTSVSDWECILNSDPYGSPDWQRALDVRLLLPMTFSNVTTLYKETKAGSPERMKLRNFIESCQWKDADLIGLYVDSIDTWTRMYAFDGLVTTRTIGDRAKLFCECKKWSHSTELCQHIALSIVQDIGDNAERADSVFTLLAKW